jgi:hypothetical protein
MAFPTQRPEGACYPRPRPNEALDVSPPGFCWWPAGTRGKVRYRLKVTNETGASAYESPVIEDPVHVPDKVLPAGRYTWIVEALDSAGKVQDTRTPGQFTITEGAVSQPWVSPEELLARVPKEHPRLLFPRAALGAVRSTLNSTRKEAFETLTRESQKALKLKPPPEPDYDKIKDPAERRLAYGESFGLMRRYHDGGMAPLALMYMLSGEKKYGETAKAILLGAAQWNPEGISSVMAPYGDEVGLGLARSEAQTYDWLYDLLTEDERALVKKMLIARADQLLRRLTKHDFLARPENSHEGRLPGYLIEHAIALAEEPRARVWMDYAMKTLLTVFPHWADQDGGWAEGISYGLGYNTIYLTPFESLRAATGFDMWQRPFYRKVRYFFLYNISPLGDVAPYGDGEDGPVPNRAPAIRALLKFHALRYNDPAVRWWVDLLATSDGKRAAVAALPGIILSDTVPPKPPTDLRPDAAFFGVGWAALHSDLTEPDKDLMVMFKSSPYGAVSHSHADQNSFVIMKGGKVLAMPAGAYFPTYGAPFHANYTRQTVAHNAILVNGKGQVVREGKANGRLTAFESKPHLGYVCGDACAAYGSLLKRCRRHVLLVRPSVVIVVDDLEAPEPPPEAEFQWLLHAKEQFDLDETGQTVVSHRGSAGMMAHLITPGGFGFAQTDAWLVSPKEGYPTAKKKDPEKQWHFTATSRDRSAKRRIAAVMFVSDNGEVTEGDVRLPSPDSVEVTAKLPAGEATVRINLAVDQVDAVPILEVEYRPKQGLAELLSVK